MKETIAKYKGVYQDLPKLPIMRKLWHCAYWDGAISGVCLVDNKHCWFECIDQFNNYPENDYEDCESETWNFEPGWYRRFLIVELTQDQFVDIEKRHNKFQRMVGTHTDYDENGHRGSFHLTDEITEETFNQFYAEAKVEPEFILEAASDLYVLGWIEI